MKKNINPDDDNFDQPDEYFRKKKELYEYEYESDEYFPEETSKPPHY